MDASRKRRILRQHLQTDQWLGAMAVPVGGAATTEPVPAPRAALSPGKPVTSLHPSPEIPRSSASPPLTMPLRTREEKQQLLTAMDDHEVKDCRRCGLCEHRTHTVFGEGDPNARLMFIGEGPGEHEDLQGRPFVGRAGELLDKMIVAMGLTRAGVYIANVVKCRPPNNRTPSPVEISVCWDYLLRQIRIIHPQIIVTLGAPATQTLLQTISGIGMLRGQWHWFQGLIPQGPAIPVMPTYHPAYLLRAYTPENRRKVWEDLQKAMTVLKGEATVPQA